MTKKLRHAAIIEIHQQYLLEMLDFDGGTIHSVSFPKDEWKPGVIEFVIEHPDLDKVEPGFQLRRITPAYHSHLRGYDRVEPVKKRRKVLQKIEFATERG